MYSVNLSPSHWLSFKSHYLVVQRVNKANGIRQWEDPRVLFYDDIIDINVNVLGHRRSH